MLLHLDHRLARAGHVREPEPLRDHAVEPGGLEAVEPAVAASSEVVAGEIQKPSPRRSSSSRRSSSGRSCTGVAVPEQQVEGDEDRRDLGRELADAALGRVEPRLHRVEVEHAVARDHDLAVERGVGREQLAERPQLGEVAQQRPPFRDQSASSPPSFSSTPRKPSHFGSYCQPSPAGSSRTSSASIGGKGTFGPGTSARLLPWASSTASGRCGASAALLPPLYGVRKRIDGLQPA